MDLKPSFEGHPGLVPASPAEDPNSWNLMESLQKSKVAIEKPTEMEVLIGTSIDSRIPIVMFDYWSVFQ